MNNPDTTAWTAITALLDEADAFAGKGETRAATSHYGAALRQAARLSQWPAGMAERLAFARDACTNYAAHYSQHLQQHLTSAGYDPQKASPRFTEALEIVLGRKQPYVQLPRFFYFPGLPNVQFYDNNQFPWLAEVEQATDAIRAELLALMADPTLFAPYVQAKEGRPSPGEGGLLNNPDWSACFVWKNGQAVLPVAQRCPATLKALAKAPLDYITERAPSILFSVLRPGARIPPHTGLLNTRLICHLPLVVPGRCGFRVGNDVREWQVGKAWAFDDTIEHEAWNDSNQARVILLFDVWRPELTAEERELVTNLVKAIDAFDGPKLDWGT
jgi:aspartyl/asparaginyl beta-hydroxylase (cupin superfamily)